jgi:hypothetical protein
MKISVKHSTCKKYNRVLSLSIRPRFIFAHFQLKRSTKIIIPLYLDAHTLTPFTALTNLVRKFGLKSGEMVSGIDTISAR